MNQTVCLPAHPLNPPNYKRLPVKYSWPRSQLIRHFRTTEAHQEFQIIYQQFLINTNLTKQELCQFVKVQSSLKYSNRIRHVHTNLKSKMVLIQSTVKHGNWILTSNKSTNQMHHFLKFITWRSCTAQHVSGFLTSIIRRSTTAVAASGFTVGAWW
jgi:hypothetical protein